jgi:hypothetical protein
MDCRTFRKKHLGFVDDTLPGIELVAMQRHVLECHSCSKHDAQVRRALLVVRNVTPIELSKDFSAKLNARLAAERVAMARPPVYPRGPGIRTFMFAAASVVAAGYIAVATLDWAGSNDSRQQDMALIPIGGAVPVATAEAAFPPPPLVDPALVASVSAGVPLWPVMFFADQAPVHFANEQFMQVSAER